MRETSLQQMNFSASASSAAKSPVRQKRRGNRMTKAGGSSVPVVPKLIAFDLDATLWYPEMYELAGPPFKADQPAGTVYDRAREEIRLIGDTRRILNTLASDELWSKTQIAYVSRTEYPEWADECLRLFKLDNGLDLHTLGVHHEIYPGSKRTHFRAIQARTGIDFADCLFFDDMQWNLKGLTMKVWEQGLQRFTEHKRARKSGGSSSSRTN